MCSHCTFVAWCFVSFFPPLVEKLDREDLSSVFPCVVIFGARNFGGAQVPFYRVSVFCWRYISCPFLSSMLELRTESLFFFVICFELCPHRCVWLDWLFGHFSHPPHGNRSIVLLSAFLCPSRHFFRGIIRRRRCGVFVLLWFLVCSLRSDLTMDQQMLFLFE